MKIDKKLIDAYNTMMKRLHSVLEEAEEKTLPSLEQNIENAKAKAIELGELTREEAEKIATYLKRDIDDAADYLQETGEEFSSWIKFDFDLIEGAITDAFINVADQTKLQLLELEQQAREAIIYHTGEITGVGTLVCEQCGKSLHFKKTGHIPPCPKCHATRFKRS